MSVQFRRFAARTTKLTGKSSPQAFPRTMRTICFAYRDKYNNFACFAHHNQPNLNPENQAVNRREAAMKRNISEISESSTKPEKSLFTADFYEKQSPEVTKNGIFGWSTRSDIERGFNSKPR
jgi:hypothetical protein